mmetsp:Transcript_143661/g.348884  ORF Transcript_143661/g.348884 Transcript_143661/m.348884 type:complete len:230 (-) Transcript_143661:433-1122(-)
MERRGVRGERRGLLHAVEEPRHLSVQALWHKLGGPAPSRCLARLARRQRRKAGGRRRRRRGGRRRPSGDAARPRWLYLGHLRGHLLRHVPELPQEAGGWVWAVAVSDGPPRLLLVGESRRLRWDLREVGHVVLYAFLPPPRRELREGHRLRVASPPLVLLMVPDGAGHLDRDGGLLAAGARGDEVLLQPGLARLMQSCPRCELRQFSPSQAHLLGLALGVHPRHCRIQA